MEIIKQGYRILTQGPGISGMKRMIEYCGRVCYRSEDKITEDSADMFIDRLEKSGHMTPLEHGTVYLKTTDPSVQQFYMSNPYSACVPGEVEEPLEMNNLHDYFPQCPWYITTNYRVLVDNGRLEDLKWWHDYEAGSHIRRTTVLMITDIGVSREFNRHRSASVNEESTRYCDYTRSKFGNGINTIVPMWASTPDKLEAYGEKCDVMSFEDYCYIIANHDTDSMQDVDWLALANMCADVCYKRLRELGHTPQEARVVLPLDTKTTVAYSMRADEWARFFALRSHGTTGAPHPQAKDIASRLEQEMQEGGML